MNHDFSEILKHLPHRYPFLFVDKIVSVELGNTIHAQKNVSINEDFFNGHFPNKPVMPGVLIIEAMAQAAGILGFMTMGKTQKKAVFITLPELIKLGSSDQFSQARLSIFMQQSDLKKEVFGNLIVQQM